MSDERALQALALLRVCPTCTGSGKVPYNGNWADPDAEMVPCARCDGGGDLLGAMLRRAYMAGRDDALDQARTGLGQVTAMLGAPVPEWMSLDKLRWRVGALS